MESVIDDFMSHVPKRISRYWKSALTIPMCQRITWEPTWKAIPSYTSRKEYM